AKYLSWGKPSNEADIIAIVPGSRGLATIFAYETGANLVNGTAAPARRVGLWLVNGTPNQLTADGQSLFDNAITYALGCTPVQALTAAPRSNTAANETIENGAEAVETATPTLDLPMIETADNQVVNEIAVFPNPAVDFVNVDLTMFADQAVEIRILDRAARLVQFVQIAAATTTERINFNNLTSGMYFIQVRSGEQVQMKKLMVK
ncbi:MAG: T9SS type A sorting domain-containing protein, partial [Saprospiraceae bacterium]